MYRHILIATDESSAGQAAVHHGVKLAKVVGAKVLFVTVTRPWSALGVREVGGTGQSDEYDKASAFDAEHILKKAAIRATRSKVKYSQEHIVADEPADAISKKASEEHCDLIVIGSPRHHGLLRFFDENEALEVEQETSLPVLIVHATSTRKQGQ